MRTGRRRKSLWQTKRPWRVVLASAVAGVAVGAVLVQPTSASDTYKVDQRLLTNVVLGPGASKVVTLPVPSDTSTVQLVLAGQLAWKPTRLSVCAGATVTSTCKARPQLTTPTLKAGFAHITLPLVKGDRRVVIHNRDASVSVTMRLATYTGPTPPAASATTSAAPRATATPSRTATATARPTASSRPSASPTPTVRATATPKATASPTPTVRPSATPTARPSSSPTPSPTPTSSSDVPGPYNTGVPSGTTLKTHSGDLTITKDGTVVDALHVKGFVRVSAKDVVIKRTKISGRSISSSLGLVMVMPGGSVTIQDSEIYAAERSPHVRAIIGSDFTLNRVNMHDVVDQLMITGDNVTVQDSWLHSNIYYEQDPTNGGKPTHDDNIQISIGSNIKILNNRMESTKNAAIMVTQDRGPVTNLQISGNRIGHGACSVNLAEKSVGPLKNVTLRDNTFVPTQTFSKCAIVADKTTIPLLSLRGNTWTSGSAVTVTERQ